MINNHLLQHIVLASAMTLALSSCSLEPKYEQPSAPVPGQYPGEQGKNGNVQKVVDIGWKSYFIDPAMQQLIGIALANNRDLRISALNVEKAAAQFRIQRTQLYPALDINSSLTGQHLPKGLYQTQFQSAIANHLTSDQLLSAIHKKIEDEDRVALNVLLSDFDNLHKKGMLHQLANKSNRDVIWSADTTLESLNQLRSSQ